MAEITYYMKTKRKTVFLTGGTGNMGWAGFQELYKRKDRFNIRLLARDSRKNHKMLDKYAGDPAVTVIWGDLTRYEDVLEGVNGSDYVLHVGGMVSPAADYFPEKTLLWLVTSIFQPLRSIYLVYILNRSPAKIEASSPPAPPRISMMAFYAS